MESGLQAAGVERPEGRTHALFLRGRTLTMQTGWLTLFVLLVSISCPAMAQVGKLYPIDEGPKDPSFQAFRAKLIEAVKNRDAKFILSILDPKILNSFGGDGGVKEFKEMWKPDNPNSELWDTLIGVLSMGGSFDTKNKNDFCAPYVYSQFPELDAFDHSVIIGEQVHMREQPGLTSPTVATLSYDIVANTDQSTEPVKKDGHSWVAIKLSNGKTGFVSKQFIRSPIDYRACFTKKRGRWLMVTLVAGD
jgi:hypothetical protein